jgi:hypothetical protein
MSGEVQAKRRGELSRQPRKHEGVHTQMQRPLFPLSATDITSSDFVIVLIAMGERRDAEMCFHQAYNPKTGQTSPEVSEAIVGVLKLYGLTNYQARALVNAAPPESADAQLRGGLSG